MAGLHETPRQDPKRPGAGELWAGGAAFQRNCRAVQSERERLARRGSEGEEAKEAPLSFSLAAAPPQDPAAPVGQAERPFGVFDLDAAVSRCYGNYDMFQEMTRHLCGEADPLLDQMRPRMRPAMPRSLPIPPPAVRHRAVPRRRARTGSGEVRRSDRPRGRVVGGVGGRRTAPARWPASRMRCGITVREGIDTC